MRDDVTLALLGAEHAAAMYRWMQDPEIRGNLGLRLEPSLQRTHDWIKAAQANPGCHPYAILWQGRHVGNVVLDQVDEHLRSARLSIYLGERGSRGQGVGLAAVVKALHEAFAVLDLNKVWLVAHPANSRAIRTYLTAGFAQEGLMQDGFLFRGELVPAVYMGALRRDFPGASRAG